MKFERICHRENGEILIAGHRGISGANIPCNTLASYSIALQQGADIVELDVSRSRDGVLYAFHPGMEKAHLGTPLLISSRSSRSVNRLRYMNQDNKKTSYCVSTLEEALLFLKGKCYINVDKYPSHPEEITAMIRKCGVEEQVIIKTPPQEKYFAEVERVAPDLMYMIVVSENDTFSETLLHRKINYIGAEVLFNTDNAPVVSDDYINYMHSNGLIVWGNSIVYDEKAVISAHHTDDVALTSDIKLGWGWFREHGFDIIQTDWVQMLREYLKSERNQTAD